MALQREKQQNSQFAMIVIHFTGAKKMKTAYLAKKLKR